MRRLREMMRRAVRLRARGGPGRNRARGCGETGAGRRPRRLAAVGDDRAVAQQHHAVGERSHLGVMRHQYDREPAAAIEPLQGGHDVERSFGVEVPGRLVGEEDRRVVDQRARHRDALLLAARQLVGMAALATGQAEYRQHFRGPRGALRYIARVEKRQLDVFQRARARQQVETLEDETDTPAADAREVRLTQQGHVHAFEQVAAGARPVEASDDVHHRGLARTRSAHDRDELASFDGEADAAQGAHFQLAEPVGLVHIAQAYDYVGHRFRARRLRAKGGRSEVMKTHARLVFGARPSSGLLRALVDCHLVAGFEIAAQNLD